MTSGGPIGILETGVPPADLAARHGRYDAMMRRMLGDGFTYKTYDVQNGVLPSRPADHPAYVITGSSAGVYDSLPWIPPLQAFIRAAHGHAKLIGICFGHQVMAEALGGAVEKSPKGWGIGLHRYEVTPGTDFAEGVASIAVAASHQDQVIQPPPGARVLAASAFTPFAALAYSGGPSMSVQFHPEFTADFARALVDLRRAALGPAAADAAWASLGAASDAFLVASGLRAFLRLA